MGFCLRSPDCRSSETAPSSGSGNGSDRHGFRRGRGGHRSFRDESPGFLRFGKLGHRAEPYSPAAGRCHSVPYCTGYRRRLGDLRWSRDCASRSRGSCSPVPHAPGGRGTQFAERSFFRGGGRGRCPLRCRFSGGFTLLVIGICEKKRKCTWNRLKTK